MDKNNMSITPQQLSSFLILAVVMSVTPGPNNVMVLSSGMQFGFRNTMRHIWGASLGSSALFILTGLGLHNIFTTFPLMSAFMKYAGAAFIFYISWKMLRDSGDIHTEHASRPMSFSAAAMFQLVNPKAWIVTSVAISTCLPSDFSAKDILLYTFLFALISFPCVGMWAWGGAFIKCYLKDRKNIKRFSLCCALTLIVTAVSMIVI